jgi:hypothetical protein
VWVIAHGIVGRADLPVPTEFFGAGAALVLVLSFLALGAGWTRPHLERVRERPLGRIPLAVEVVLGALGVAVFAVTAYAGLVGSDVQSANLAPTAVYVGFWVGIPFLSLVLGDVFRLLSPWRAIGRAVGWAGRRIGGEGMPEPLPYPARLGQWPGAAGIFAFAVCELCWATGREPTGLAVVMLLYLAIQLVGMSLYGVEAWTRNADGFGVWFGLVASLAPVGRRADGRLVLRPPVAGAAAVRATAGTAGLLIVSIASTGFDGAKEGPLFNDAAGTMQDAFVSLGLSKGLGLELAFVVGLIVAVCLVSLVWNLGMAGMSGRGLDRAALSRRFAHTLIPIAVGYVVAHYFSLLAYNGQDLWRLASDPLGRGSDLFGGAQSTIDYAVVTATAIWYVQTGALVLGHVAGLVLAHDRALVVMGVPPASARAASRSQIVMLVVMVLFTLLGMWLLSAALNT